MELTVTEIAKEYPVSAREINEILEREKAYNTVKIMVHGDYIQYTGS